MDLYYWGNVDFLDNDSKAFVSKYKSNFSYFVTFDKNTMHVNYDGKGHTLLEFTDELLDINNLGTFKRNINNQTYYFKNGELQYKTKNYKFKTIKNLLPKGYFNNKIITLDIETRCENDLIIPYAIS